MNICAQIVIGLVFGVLAATGVGGGSVLIICLTVFGDVPQRLAQGISLLCFIPISAISLFLYTKKGLIAWRKVLPCMALGVVGSLLGFYILGLVSQQILSKIFGIVLIIIAVMQWPRPGKLS